MPFYELLYLPFEEGAEKPQFREQAKAPQLQQQGFVLYYSHQCPFTAKYVPLIEKMARDRGGYQNPRFRDNHLPLSRQWR